MCMCGPNVLFACYLCLCSSPFDITLFFSSTHSLHVFLARVCVRASLYAVYVKHGVWFLNKKLRSRGFACMFDYTDVCFHVLHGSAPHTGDSVSASLLCTCDAEIFRTLWPRVGLRSCHILLANVNELRAIFSDSHQKKNYIYIAKLIE